MSLIQMSDRQTTLYREWLVYLGESTPETRTLAFFNSREGVRVPLMGL